MGSQTKGRSLSSLDAYLENWSLSSPSPLATTPTSQVYRVRRKGAPLVLKILTEVGERDEGSGAVALSYFAGEGAVRLLQHDSHAQLLEWVEGKDLSTFVSDGKDDLATIALSEVLRKLHRERDSIPEGLIPLRERFLALLEYAGGEELLNDGAVVARVLSESPEDDCVLHGDLHHQNVLHSKGRGWLAIDPKGLRGERAFDAANILFNPLALPAVVLNPKMVERRTRILCERLRLDRKRFLAFAFAYGALSVCWLREDGLDNAATLELTGILRKMI